MTDKPKQQVEAGRLGGLKSKGRKLTEQHKQRIRETKLRQAAIIRQYEKEHEGETLNGRQRKKNLQPES